MPRKTSPEPEVESPISLGPTSNGEVPPPPFTRRHRIAHELYLRVVDEKSRRLGISRRAFVESSCGTLAALWVFNQATACSHSSGAGTSSAERDAGYDVPRDALEDRARADAMLSGDEFIFDVQVHNSVPKPPWDAALCRSRHIAMCPTDWVKEIFVASDTDVACLSGYPAARGNEAPAMETRSRFKQTIDMLDGSPRLLIHANVHPAQGAAELDAAQKDVETYPIAAWKTYPDGGRLDEPALSRPGAFFERARAMGLRLLCAHRGFGGTVAYEDPYSPRDVVGAAKLNPDFTFLVYHSGFDGGVGERKAYDERNPSGVDRLIKAMNEFGLGPSDNVYAELGSTWNQTMNDPVQAAHCLGKLLRYLGPDRILWGTDSVNNGGPQGQIDAFRRFTIPSSMQETFGYPALTAEVKAKILGLNAARVYGVDVATRRRKLVDDDVARLKLVYRDDRDAVAPPSFRPHGPRTRREYLAFKRWSGEEA